MKGGAETSSFKKEQQLPQPSSSVAPSSHWTLMVVFLSLLVDLLGFTVILPLIPSMLEYYSKNDKVGWPLDKIDRTIQQLLQCFRDPKIGPIIATCCIIKETLLCSTEMSE